MSRRIEIEEKGHVYTYVNLLWSELFAVARLIGMDRIGEAYGRLMSIIPLLPDKVKNDALKELEQSISMIKSKIESMAVDETTKNLMKMTYGRRMLKKHLLKVLSDISSELEALGYKRYLRAVEVGGEM